MCGERGPEAFCYKLNQFSEESLSFARVLLRREILVEELLLRREILVVESF